MFKKQFLKKKLASIYHLLGKEIAFYASISIATGLFLFIAEYSFVYSLQAFLLTLGIGDIKTVQLPDWIPDSQVAVSLLLIIIGSSRVALTQFKTYLGRMANQAFLKRFRAKILEYSITNASKVSSHEVFGIFSDTLSRAGSVVIESMSLIVSIIASSLLLIAGLRIAPYEMMIGLFLVLLIIIPLRKVARIALKSGLTLNRSWDSTSKILLEGLRHHYFLKTHGLIDSQIKRGKDEIEHYESNHKNYFLLTSIKNSVPQILGLFILISLAYIGKKYFKTEGSALVAFLYLFLRISQTGGEIMTLVNNIAFNFSSIESLYKWDQEVGINNVTTISEESNIKVDIGSLELSRVTFSHNKQPLLKDVSLSAQRGEVIIIDAPSGTGKSTLIGLILNILKPQSGEIKLNGVPIDKFRGSFRNSISYVGPDPFFLNETVRKNICYGLKEDEVSEEDIWNSLELTNSKEFIEKLELGIDEALNEHTQLSTGQKQRLAISRALLRKPDLLILDEATANLDQNLEQEIANNIKAYMKDGIVIIVSHKGYIKRIGTKELYL